MNIHEVIDRFGSQTPRTKTISVIAIILVIAAVLGSVFYFGIKAGDGWSESKYLKKRAEAQIKIAQYEANQKRLEGVNDVLKKQNEELAAEITANDKRRIAEFNEKARLRDIELKTKAAEIDAQSNAPAVICGTCEAARKAGYELSTEFCGQCWRQP